VRDRPTNEVGPVVGGLRHAVRHRGRWLRSDYADLVTPAGLRGVARYAQGIGPDELQVIPRRADGTLGSPTTLVTDAHHAALVVHPYTFRAENDFLPVDYQSTAVPTDYGRAIDEQVTYLRAGLDGLFIDQADIGVVARAEFRATTPAGR
jgi:glycerophosphoryl diester phosphodiesterase